MNVTGGEIGSSFEAFDSVVNISGGEVGAGFDAANGSEVNISGGVTGTQFDAFDGSEVNISGGVVGAGFDAFDGSVVNISGGEVGTDFDAFGGSVVNISGGVVGDVFAAFDGSEVNLLGSEFFLAGELIDASTLDGAFTISDRAVTLSGILNDGSLFSFDLNPIESSGNDFFASGATLTVTVASVPEPSSALALLGLSLIHI